MFQARGRYQKTWTGKAAGNLPKQVPLIAPGFPDVVQYHPATVNVEFGPKIIVAGQDHRTPPIRWKAVGEDGEGGEVFDFVRVELTFEPLAVTARALLVVGHWSVHRLDPHRQEFLVERFIDGLQHDMPITMTCDRPFVALPYTKTASTENGLREARTIVVL